MTDIDLYPMIWKMEKVGEEYFFWDVIHNALFSWDGYIASIIPVECTRNRAIYADNTLFNSLYNKGGKLYLVPETFNKALVYSIDDKNEHYIDFPRAVNAYIDSQKCLGSFFSKIVFDADFAYYIGSKLPYIVVLDLIKEEFVESLYLDIKAFSFFKDAVLFNGRIYLVEAERHDVIIVDTHTMNGYSIKRIGDITKGFSSICAFNKSLFLIPRYDENLVEWNIESDDVTVINDYPANYSFCKNGVREIGFSTFIDNKIYLFPAKASDVIYLDLSSKSIEVDSMINNEVDIAPLQNNPKCLFLDKINEELIVQSGYSRALFVYNCFDKTVKKKVVLFDDEEICRFIKLRKHRYIRSSEIVYEYVDLNLSDLISSLI